MNKQVILLITDTTRKDMVGCYGNPDMKTPNLDRLAKEGVAYDNAYCCQPVCCPARGAIFTGMAPHSNGAVANGLPLYDGVDTIGQILSRNGYESCYIGKWHLDGGDYFGTGKCPEGWDDSFWYDMRRYLDELSEEDRTRSRKSITSFDPDWTEEMTYAHRCTNRGIDFLHKYSGQDFFLTVSYDEPHGPSICPAPFNSMYDGYRFPDNPSFYDDLEHKPFMQKLWAGKALHYSKDQLNQPSKKLSLFLGCNSYADYEIGRLLDEVEKSAPDALIIYTSDHGDMLGAHRLQQKNATVYKEVANIPLIIRGGVKDTHISYPASHIDIAPTILDYMGVKVPVRMQGHSMLRQIHEPELRVNDAVFTEFTRYEVDHDGFGGLQMMRGIISDRYKLAVHLMDTDEFYDIKEDPDEVHNLIDDERYAEIRDRMHDMLLNHMNDTRDYDRGYQWEARPWRKDKIASWENDGFTRQAENDEGECRQLDYDTGLPMKEAVRKKSTNAKAGALH